jgi:hypothetical protein
MERATTTIRLKPSTVRILKSLGRKGETYDQIIRRRIAAGIDLGLLVELRKAEREPSIPSERIPWDDLFKMSEEELDELIKELTREPARSPPDRV